VYNIEVNKIYKEKKRQKEKPQSYAAYIIAMHLVLMNTKQT
jgi:hypothetical protein